MAVPKKKTSVSKKRMRHAHSRLKMPAMSLCSNCGNVKAPHAVCLDCGHYKKRLVIRDKALNAEAG